MKQIGFHWILNIRFCHIDLTELLSNNVIFIAISSLDPKAIMFSSNPFFYLFVTHSQQSYRTLKGSVKQFQTSFCKYIDTVFSFLLARTNKQKYIFMRCQHLLILAAITDRIYPFVSTCRHYSSVPFAFTHNLFIFRSESKH